MTNMTDIHTLSTGGVHFILPLVFVSNGEMIEFTCNVVSCTSIWVPISVYSIGSIVDFLVILCIIGITIFMVSMPTILGCVSFSLADLASDIYSRTRTTTSTPASTTT